MPNREEVERAIQSLTNRMVSPRGDNSIWIQCPYHANGSEKTPSLKINLEGGKYPIGSWRCFGCAPPKNGNWHRLAVRLGLRSSDDDEDIPYASELNESVKNKLLSEDDDDDLQDLHNKLLREPIVQKTQNWRGIKGWLLNEIEARTTMLNSNGDTTEYSRVYLPVKVNGRWRGGIFCSWSDKTKMKYENEKHVSSEILFPYDYVVSKLEELPFKERRICIVEGPRDALNLLQNDILALANLGGDTVWSDEKSELISDLNLSSLVVATDPDNVGQSLANSIKRSLEGVIPRITRFKMEVKLAPSGRVLEKEDPGNLSYERMQYLKEQMENL